MESLEKNEKEMLKRELAVERENLPLVIIYKDKRYVLILTKNERLVLHKAME